MFYKPRVFTFSRKVVKYTRVSFSLLWPTSWLLKILRTVSDNNNQSSGEGRGEKIPIKIALTEETNPELPYVGRPSSRQDQYLLAPDAWSRKHITGLLITNRAG